MPSISETGGETFTNFQGFGGSSLGYAVQNMEGHAHPIFGEKVGKLNL